MHPLLDLTELSEPQIIEKIALSSARMMAVRKSGQSTAIVDQLKLVVESCYEELARREEEKQTTAEDKNPVAWDMDSYLESNDYDNSKELEEESMPRWKRDALSQLGDDDNESPWG